MNFTKNHNRTKDEIKSGFLSFFKTQDVKHLVAHKLKEIKKILNDFVRDYNKRFKDLLSNIPYIIDKVLPMQ
jgi:hypothetical protein